MDTRFETVHNYNELATFDRVSDAVARFPVLADRPDLLADVACIALNRLPPRYVRHDIDARFYMSNEEHTQNEAAVIAAVEFALDFVLSRTTARQTK
jgi:hypothetical protein